MPHRIYSIITLGTVLILVGAGCGQPSSVNTPRNEAPALNAPAVNSPAATASGNSVKGPAAPENPAPTAPTNAPATTTEKPVEYTYLGITPDKKHFTFKIKILSANPIRQVDIESTCTNESGGQRESTYAWQNIVTSVEQPIEQGETYQDTGYSGPGTVTCETNVGLVHFADGTKWGGGRL